MKFETLRHLHEMLKEDASEKEIEYERIKKVFSDFRKDRNIDDWGRYVKPEDEITYNLLSDMYTAAHKSAMDAAAFLSDFEESSFTIK